MRSFVAIRGDENPKPARSGGTVTSRLVSLLFPALTCAAIAACTPRPTSDLVHIPTLAGRAPPPSATVVPVHEGPPRAAVAVEPTGHRTGDKIRVEWHGQLYPATVLGAAAGGLTRIHYDGYGAEWDEDVDESRISGAEDEVDD